MSSCLSHLHKYVGVLELPSLAFLNLISCTVELVSEHFVTPPLDVIYLTLITPCKTFCKIPSKWLAPW
jgi:hypothetical protein